MIRFVPNSPKQFLRRICFNRAFEKQEESVMAGVAGNKLRAGALALAMAFTPAAFAETAANQNTAPQQTTAVTAEQARAAEPTVQPAFQVASSGMPPTGAPVTLNYGSSISPELIASAARVLGEMGCPVTLVQRGSPTRVIAQTNGKGAGFNDPGAAATWALDNCRS
jgi:hypothetical protein